MLFYVVGLGATRDPYIFPGLENIWLNFGRTQVHHMAGMELRRRSLFAEEGSIGILHWSDGKGRFDQVDERWLLNFPRTSWQHWLEIAPHA